MLVAAESRIEPTRFAGYIEELRDFSHSHHLPYGDPENLPSLLDQLNRSPRFREECISMLRSVFYREHGAAPPEELLMLLIVAWGGEPTGPPSPTLQATITDLLRFTVGIMRTPVVPSELPPEPFPQPHLESLPTEPTESTLAPAPLAPAPIAPLLPATELPATPQPDTSSPRSAAKSTGIEDIDSAIQLLSIRSPDVKRYLQLLKYREVQHASDQLRIAQAAAQRSTQLALQSSPDRQPSEAIPLAQPRAEAPATLGQGRPNPWDPNSEFQMQLRRFAAEREARIAAYEARHRPASSKIADAAEAAWHRLVGRKRHPS